jgi:hypothetical protein
MSPKRVLQWAKLQQDAGAWAIMLTSDQFLARIVKKGGRENIIEIGTSRNGTLLFLEYSISRLNPTDIYLFFQLYQWLECYFCTSPNRKTL